MDNGVYFINFSSKSLIGKNVNQVSFIGLAKGETGVVSFQGKALSVLESIIRNSYPEYSLPVLIRNEFNPLFLFYTPDNIFQAQNPSSELLKKYLLMNNSLTIGTTLEIVDIDKIKFIEFLSEKTFSIFRNASKEIYLSRIIGIRSKNNRFNKKTVNSNFSLEVIIH